MRLAEFLFVLQPYRTPDGHDNKTGPADDSGGNRAQKGIINAACHKISGGRLQMRSKHHGQSLRAGALPVRIVR